MTRIALFALSGILLLSGCGTGESSSSDDDRNGRVVVGPDVYGPWSELSACTASCGPGYQTRTRACFSADGLEVGCARCGGECQESTACEGTAGCAYAYGPWSFFGDCSAECGGGTETRTRECIRNDGASVDCSLCGGACSESRACNGVAACAYNYTKWHEPSSCSNSCGSGTQTQQRDCLNSSDVEVACSFCGDQCIDAVVCTDYSGCSFEYTSWREVGQCSTRCGQGTQRYTRGCTRSDGRSVDCSSCGGFCDDEDSCEDYSGCEGPLEWTFTVPSVYSDYTGHLGVQSRDVGGLSDGEATYGSTIWGSNYMSEPWIIADFGAVFYVTRVIVSPIFSSFGWGPSYLINSDLQYSLDGTEWVTITQLTDIADYTISEIDVNVQARYIRVIRTGNTTYLGMGEFSFR
jgi:hypothetical protein